MARSTLVRGASSTRRRCILGVGACIVALGWLLGPLAAPADARILFAPKRFKFNIEPQTPLKDLLPEAPDSVAVTPPWLVQDLAQVPQILFQKPEAVKKNLRPEPKTPGEEEQAVMQTRLEQDSAMRKTAHAIAKINHLNQKGTDHFLKVLLEIRHDLDGLPFVMGDACRQSKQRALAFFHGVSIVDKAREGPNPDEDRLKPNEKTAAKEFWNYFPKARDKFAKEAAVEIRGDAVECEHIAALMQMLAPQPAMLTGLVQHLSDLDHADATRALVRLAIYSFEEDVRRPALAALKSRRTDDCTGLLLAGLRHPWPAVARNAGEAVAQLGRKDLIPQLVALLDEADPRAPTTVEIQGEKKLAVRELVRVNHHRNCLLCHAPHVKSDKFGVPAEVLTGAVPSPGEPFPTHPSGYSPNSSPDILVRVDVTYLRQDFSLLQPVKDAAPWPDMQRFDFLVRTRAVSAEEAAGYQKWLQQQGPGYLAPHHQAAVAALRVLTGRDPPEPTAKAWRSVLGGSGN